jgi:lysozyme
MRPVPSRAVAFVQQHEGCRLVAYQDSALVWTIGYGHTGSEVGPGLKISQRQADIYLKADLVIAARRLAERVPAEVLKELSEGQYSALISFVFNLGANKTWTIWKVLAARQYEAVPAQMSRFVYAGGRKLKGLINRRNAEIALWHEDAEDVTPPSSFTRAEETPPAPEPARALSNTSTAAKATMGGGGGVAVAAAQIKDVVEPHSYTSSILTWVLIACTFVIVGAGLWQWWIAHKQAKARAS